MNSISLLSSSYHDRLASRSSTLHSLLLLLSSVCCVLSQALGKDYTENSLYCYGGVFTGPLLNNRRSPVACVRFAGMCLPSRCLAMGIHITHLLVYLHSRGTDWNLGRATGYRGFMTPIPYLLSIQINLLTSNDTTCQIYLKGDR
jgi:hypothetical protein